MTNERKRWEAAPKEIYLLVGDDTPADVSFKELNHKYVLWSESRDSSNDIKYVKETVDAEGEDFAVWLVARWFYHPTLCLWYKKNDKEQLKSDGKSYTDVISIFRARKTETT